VLLDLLGRVELVGGGRGVPVVAVGWVGRMTRVVEVDGTVVDGALADCLGPTRLVATPASPPMTNPKTTSASSGRASVIAVRAHGNPSVI
jgi:hypothetical protein